MASVSLSPYVDLLRLPGVLRLVLVALVARVPHAASGVVVTLHVVLTLDKGYGQAGVVVAAVTIGSAIGAPWRGRRVDTLGLRRALVPSVVVESAVWVVAPFLGYEALVVAAFVAGLFLVPVFSVVRQSLGVLVPPAQQRTGFALDSVGTELTFMLAPVVGVLVATQVSTTVALVSVGVSTVAAGALLIWFDPPTRTSQVHARAAAAASVDAEGAVPLATPVPAAAVPGAAVVRVVTPALMVVLAAAVAVSFVLNATDVSIVAALESWDRESSVGWVIALWAGGSVVGGLAYGAGRRAVHPLVLVLVLALLTLPAALAGTPLLLAAAVVLAGVPCAPALSSITAALVRLAPEERRGEVMGWQGTAMTVGAAVGAPLCGWFIDRHGAGAGFLTASVLGVVLAGGGLLVLRLSRDRSLRSATVVAPDAADEAPVTVDARG
ncbi:MFS transporter [Cellulomonas cellasea]|uniref:MFS transporter n=1 Tax=Cellulomonas cellasea TaxID=43670 RepID=UPI00161172DB|nr:MFS transporter [Cellulomonas cellasea]